MTAHGCIERYIELCALLTAGALHEHEERDLIAHASQCPDCAQLLNEYQAFASTGLAKIAAEMTDPEELVTAVPTWPKAKVKELLLAQAAQPTNGVSLNHPQASPSLNPESRLRRNVFRASAVAASLVLTAAVSYQVGMRRASLLSSHIYRETSALRANPAAGQSPKESSEFVSLRAERDALQAQLEASDRSIEEFASRTERDKKQIEDLKLAQGTLEESASRLTQQGTTQAQALESLTRERAGLQQQLENTRELLQNVQRDLDLSRQDRERALLRSAALQTEVDSLNERSRLAANTSKQQEQFLASDRDIRELMGARQLYIADVFDVNQDGKNSKAFGRVFYTKGKSLIFYAFDLDRQPSLREAKAFQAWGRPEAARSSPISLGIFYLDSESNRRWVLKADDPELLAKINAVFVTAEPRGGSKKPSGKPFLFAYLRSLPPNHP